MYARKRSSDCVSEFCLAAVGASAQGDTPSQVVSSTQACRPTRPRPTTPRFTVQLYLRRKVPADDVRSISGEQSNDQDCFRPRRLCVHQQRLRSRRARRRPFLTSFGRKWTPYKVQWFKWQDKLMKAMGTLYQGYRTTGDHSTFSPMFPPRKLSFILRLHAARRYRCGPMQERPSPPYKPAETVRSFCARQRQARGHAGRRARITRRPTGRTPSFT